MSRKRSRIRRFYTTGILNIWRTGKRDCYCLQTSGWVAGREKKDPVWHHSRLDAMYSIICANTLSHDAVPDANLMLSTASGTASCSRGKLECFIDYVNNFHPALQFTWEISETSVLFLDFLVSINGNKLTTSVF